MKQTKWEYKTETTSAKECAPFLYMAGQDGWELTEVIYKGTDWYMFFMKRPVAGTVTVTESKKKDK